MWKYLFFFIANFIVACFIYDEPTFVKPFLQSFLLLILIVVIDVVNHYRKTKKENQ